MGGHPEGKGTPLCTQSKGDVGVDRDSRKEGLVPFIK